MSLDPPPLILVLDDNIDLAEMVLGAIELRGWKGEHLVGADLGLERVKQGGVSAILTDIRMPGGTGIELLRRLRHLPDPPPVVVMTAVIDGGERYLLTLGAKEVLQKPFEIQRSLEILEAWIRTHRSHKLV